MASTQTRHRVNHHAPYFRKCVTQKIGFATREAALDVAERMMEAGKVKPGCHITPYLCPECHEYHVSNRVIVLLPKDAQGSW